MNDQPPVPPPLPPPVPPPVVVTNRNKPKHKAKPRQKQKSKAKNFFLRHWPKHIGKRIIAIAAILWILYLPFCPIAGIYLAYRGAQPMGNGSYTYFPDLQIALSPIEMSMRTSKFISDVFWMSTYLWVTIAALGFILYFVSPDKPQPKE